MAQEAAILRAYFNWITEILAFIEKYLTSTFYFKVQCKSIILKKRVQFLTFSCFKFFENNLHWTLFMNAIIMCLWYLHFEVHACLKLMWQTRHLLANYTASMKQICIWYSFTLITRSTEPALLWFGWCIHSLNVFSCQKSSVSRSLFIGLNFYYGSKIKLPPTFWEFHREGKGIWVVPTFSSKFNNLILSGLGCC